MAQINAMNDVFRKIPSGGGIGDRTTGGAAYFGPLRDTGVNRGAIAKHEREGAAVVGRNPAPSGTGTTGTATTGAGGNEANVNGVPSRFAADVSAMTLAGAKPHDIHDWMQARGVNLSVATCGQFMGQVVREHGGTPPQNPALASNWNTFGGREGAGYSSDPNAINIAVRQGTPIGSQGSHVTAAVPVYDDKGNITGFRGVGANQGEGRGVVSSHPLNIGTGRGQFAIRHQIVAPATGAAPATSAAGDRATLDRHSARTQKVEATGKLTANINAPKGTDVTAEGGGVFRKVEVNRQVQMAKTKPAAMNEESSHGALK